MSYEGFKEGMVLSGGGAFGAYEVGVMEALFKGKSPVTGYQPLDSSIFTGTSVGAFNASVVVSQPEKNGAQAADYLKDVWLNVVAENPQRCGNGIFRLRGDPATFLSVQCLTTHPLEPFVALAADSAFFTQAWFRKGINFLRSSEELEERVLELIDLSEFFSVEPFRQTINETIPLEGIRSSDKVLRIAATDWKAGTPKIFANQDLTDEIGVYAIMASAALPGIFPPVEISGVPYVDGGVGMNTPLKPAIRAGATTIHIIYLLPPVRDIPLERLQNSIDTVFRTQVIEWAIKANEDLATVRWINRGLAIIERAARGAVLSALETRDLIRAVGQIELRSAAKRPYRKLTIHRYIPDYEIGGPLRILDFSPDSLIALIAHGYDDAVNHNCAANDCVLPE